MDERVWVDVGVVVVWDQGGLVEWTLAGAARRLIGGGARRTHGPLTGGGGGIGQLTVG